MTIDQSYRLPTDEGYRRHAIAAGILFIIATALLFVGESIYQPVLGSSDALSIADPESDRAALGILIEFICILAIPMIAVALYPVLGLFSRTLALAYVVLRTLEAVIFVIEDVNKLLIISLSQAYLDAPATDAGALQVVVDALISDSTWSGPTGPIYNLTFVTGALVLYGVLYQTRLIPRWISGWGAIAALVLGVLAVLVIFIDVPDSVAIPLIAPIAVQEMVMAVWFLVKGFDSMTLARLTAEGSQ